MTGDTFLLVLFGVIGAILLYVLLAELVSRSFRLDDGGTVECVKAELDEVGHYIALHHHVPEFQRYNEPVILAHGLGANRYNMDFFDDGVGGDRMSLARTLARAGFDVWVLETRGHGEAKVPPGADWNVDDEVREDVPTAIETVLALTHAEKVLWVGHSWGGILQYFFLSGDNPLRDRIGGFVAIGSPATLRHQPNLRMLHTPGRLFTALIRTVPLAWLGRLGVPIVGWLNLFPKLFFSNLAPLDSSLLRRMFASMSEDIPKGIIRQCVAWARTGELHSKEYGPLEPRLERITTPTLFIAGSADMIAPPPAMQFAADRIGSEDVQFIVMGRERGCDNEYGHGGLLLGRHAPDEVFPVIERWLVRHASSDITNIWSINAPKNGKSNGHV